MAQPQKTKGSGKGDGENPQRPAAESEHQPQDLSTASHLARYVQQDLEAGVRDDPVSFLKEYGDEEAPSGDDRDTATPHDSVQADGQQSAQVADDHNNANSPDEQLIFDAMEKGAAAKLDKLLSRGVGSPDCRDSQGRTPLIVAAEAGQAALVGVIARHTEDVNAVDTDGETAAMKAAYGGYLDVVELLVSKGAALDMRNTEGLSALEIAQQMGHEAVVAFLSAQSQDSTSDIKSETSTAPAFENQNEPETRGDYREETAAEPTSHTESDPASADPTDEARQNLLDRQDAVTEKDTETRPAPLNSSLPENGERIEFDALDNKQVRSINGKIIKIFDKAGFEIGDYIIDTVDKGSYIAVLKSRSQENKRWLKLRKHPEWLADPKRLTELRGGCAVRRFCLAEGIEVSPFGISHFIELYYLRDLKLILTLAQKASANNYTVRQLKQAAGDLREHKDDHDPGKEIIRTLDQPVPILEDPDLMALCTDKDRVLDELSKAERRKIRALIKARKPGLDEWKNLMDTFEGILSDLEDN